VDFENVSDRSLTIACSLATIISKNFNAKNSNNAHLIDKCPTFVSKEKKRTLFFGGVRAKKNLVIQGHNFELKHYVQLTHCNQSQEIIWGIGPQGYHCSRKN
jgi:Rho guanine nucleotide exchange factor 12